MSGKNMNLLYDTSGAHPFNQTRAAGGMRINDGELPAEIVAVGDALGHPRPSVPSLLARDGRRVEKTTYGDTLAEGQLQLTFDFIDDLVNQIPSSPLALYPWLFTDSASLRVQLTEEINAIAPEAAYYAAPPNVQYTQREWTAELSYWHQGAEMNRQQYATPRGQAKWAALNRQVNSAILRAVEHKFYARLVMAGTEERNRELFSSAIFSAGITEEIVKQQHFAVLFDPTGVTLKNMIAVARGAVSGGLNLAHMDPAIMKRLEANEDITFTEGLQVPMMDVRAGANGSVGVKLLTAKPIPTIFGGSLMVHVDRGMVIGHPDNQPFFHLRRPTHYCYQAAFGPRRLLGQVEKESDIRTSHLDIGMQHMEEARSPYKRVPYEDSLKRTFLWGNPEAPGFNDPNPGPNDNGRLGHGTGEKGPQGHWLAIKMSGTDCARSGDSAHSRNGKETWAQVIGQISPLHIRRPQLDKYVDSVMMRFYPTHADRVRALTGMRSLYKTLFTLENKTTMRLADAVTGMVNAFAAGPTSRHESKIDRIINGNGAFEIYMDALKAVNDSTTNVHPSRGQQIPEGLCSPYAIMKLSTGAYDDWLHDDLKKLIREARDFIADFTSVFRHVLGASHVVNKFMAPTNTPNEDLGELGEDVAILSLLVKPRRAIYFAHQSGQTDPSAGRRSNNLRIISGVGPFKRNNANVSHSDALEDYFKGAVSGNLAKIALVTGFVKSNFTNAETATTAKSPTDGSDITLASMRNTLLTSEVAIGALASTASSILSKFQTLSVDAKKKQIALMRSYFLTMAMYAPPNKTAAKKLVNAIRKGTTPILRDFDFIWKDSASTVSKIKIDVEVGDSFEGQTGVRASDGTAPFSGANWVRTPLVFSKNMAAITTRDIVAVDSALNSGLPLDVAGAEFRLSNNKEENQRRQSDSNGVSVGFENLDSFVQMFDRRLAAGSSAGNTKQYLHLNSSFIRRLHACANTNDILKRAISLGYALLHIDTWNAMRRSLNSHVLLPHHVSAVYVDMQIEGAFMVLTKQGGATGAVYMAGLSAAESRDNTNDLIKMKKAGHIEMMPTNRKNVRVLPPLVATRVIGGSTLIPFRHPQPDEEGIAAEFKQPIAVRPSLLFICISDEEFEQIDGVPFDIIGRSEEDRSTAVDHEMTENARHRVNYSRHRDHKVISSCKWLDSLWGLSAHVRNSNGMFGTYAETAVSTYYNTREGGHTLYVNATGALKSTGWGVHAGRLYSGIGVKIPGSFDIAANTLPH